MKKIKRILYVLVKKYKQIDKRESLKILLLAAILISLNKELLLKLVGIL